ncbi:hypothetical protein B296_00021305 [Ensete ventricosum]|uniref:Uncharacterized protein n=1 Tax=Ensete ventricosum TaxID=4639 RepID=A0A426YY76_ENSVE|nr:hypothetical protein B296_00021305 [Ensete ventricosum]
MESGHRRIPSGRGKAYGSDMAATACLLVITLLGVALLVWWSAVFHPGNEQLWMVPLGLLMVGTPAMICFALSSACTDRHWSKLERSMNHSFLGDILVLLKNELLWGGDEPGKEASSVDVVAAFDDDMVHSHRGITHLNEEHPTTSSSLYIFALMLTRLPSCNCVCIDAYGGGRCGVYGKDGGHLVADLLEESQPRSEAT